MLSEMRGKHPKVDAVPNKGSPSLADRARAPFSLQPSEWGFSQQQLVKMVPAKYFTLNIISSHLSSLISHLQQRRVENASLCLLLLLTTTFDGSWKSHALDDVTTQMFCLFFRECGFGRPASASS